MNQFLNTLFRRSKPPPGSPPGLEYLADTSVQPMDDAVSLQRICFSQDHFEQQSFADIESLLEAPVPEWATSQWIDVQGLHPYVLKRLQDAFDLHTLAAEDALNVPQRSKVEDYDSSLFIVLKMLRMNSSRALLAEQVSFFFLGTTLITVQEMEGDVWDSVRKRIEKPTSRFRKYGTPYLVYALIDAIVDHIFPLLETYFERIQKLEEEILSDSARGAQLQVHNLKRELAFLRQSVWPIRDVISDLVRDESELFSVEVETYLRDVYDHLLQVIEVIEAYRETANNLQDLLIAASGNRMNEVMKALTIMASLFLPITFFAGVYGMNFEHIPELGWPYAYPTFWTICIATTLCLLYYFRRKGWIGK